VLISQTDQNHIDFSKEAGNKS
jgi:glycosyltransferase involved in cell wall biosynthesis